MPRLLTVVAGGPYRRAGVSDRDEGGMVRLIRFATPTGSRIGIEDGENGDVLDLSRAIQLHHLATTGETGPLYEDCAALAADGLLNATRVGVVTSFIAAHGLASHLVLAEAPRRLAPVLRPQKIIGIAFNYARYAEQMGIPVPEEPVLFSKAPSAVIGPEEPVVLKDWMGPVDPEVELAVIIGRRARDVALDQAMAHIGGYTIVNDVTARDVQRRDVAHHLPWFRAKGMDTFCPMGPRVVLTDEISDPGVLELELRVNGDVRQRASTEELLFDVPFLVHYVSRLMTLEPGDVLATGTPAGIAPVSDGDVIEAEVRGIGLLRNPVVGQ